MTLQQQLNGIQETFYNWETCKGSW